MKLQTRIIVILALLVTLALAVDLTPLLRGGAGWRWPYEVPAESLRLLPGLIALAIYLVAGTWWALQIREDAPRWQVHLTLALIAAGGLIVQLALLSFYGPPIQQLFMRTVSTLSGGFYEVGVDIEDTAAFLRDYPDLMGSWTAHPNAHPPGTVLLFKAAQTLFAGLPGLADRVSDPLRAWQCHHRDLLARDDAALSAALVGMGLPVAGLLAVWPVYDLGRRLYGQRAGWLAALWLPLLPAFVMFAAQFNQLHMLFTAVALWLAHRALSELRPIWFLLAGVWLSLATFQSFTAVNLIGLLGVYGLCHVVLVGRHVWGRGEWRRLGVGLALGLVGLASAWIVYYAIARHTPLDLLRAALDTHYGLQEPYLPWLLFFPLDFALFSGIALALLAGAAGIAAAREAITRRNEPLPGAVLPLAALLTVLTLDLSGVARGEVGRLMLVIMPVVPLVAAGGVSERQKAKGERQKEFTPSVLRTPPPPVGEGQRSVSGGEGEIRLGREAGWIGGTLAAQLMVMVAFLRVIGHDLAPAPDPGFGAELPASAIPMSATFVAGQGDGAADLIGYEAAVNPSDRTLDLTLYWRAVLRFERVYFVSGIVVGPQGEALGVLDWLPVVGSYPTTCWQVGEVVVDRISIPLQAAPPGDYWISVALFDRATDERLAVFVPGLDTSYVDSAPRRDTQVGIGPVRVP